MSGSLAIATTFAAVTTDQPASLLDADLAGIAAYINARENTTGLFSARPAAGVAGRFYTATDQGNALYFDNGSVWVQLSGGTTLTVAPDGLTGLTLANDGVSPLTVLDLGAGGATSDDATLTNRVFMTLASAYTKNMNAPWAVGSGNGGNNTFATLTATTWYHVFLIERPDTGVVDVLCDRTVNLTLPAAYTKKRRLGSFLTDGAAHIVAFTQNGDEFWWTVPVLDVNSGDNPGATAITQTLASVPTGLAVLAIVNIGYTFPNNMARALYASPLFTTDAAASLTAAPLGQVAGGSFNPSAGSQARVWTNTAGQIRVRISASGAGDQYYIATLGWLDRRGRG